MNAVLLLCALDLALEPALELAQLKLELELKTGSRSRLSLDLSSPFPLLLSPPLQQPSRPPSSSSTSSLSTMKTKRTDKSKVATSPQKAEHESSPDKSTLSKVHRAHSRVTKGAVKSSIPSSPMHSTTPAGCTDSWKSLCPLISRTSGFSSMSRARRRRKSCGKADIATISPKFLGK